MDVDRRGFLSGASVVAATALGIGAGSTVLADNHNISVTITDVNPEGETVILTNTGDERVDISGYVIDWEYNQPDTQLNELPEDTEIGAGDSITIATGYNNSEGTVTYDYDAGRINNENPDVIALLTPDESEVVTTSEETSTSTETATATPTEEPAETATEEATETATEEPTETTTEESTETATEEPTETTTAEPTETADGTTDSDGDGLSDKREAELGTDPNDPDTDGDGWSDLSEANRGCDPLDSSSHP